MIVYLWIVSSVLSLVTLGILIHNLINSGDKNGVLTTRVIIIFSNVCCCLFTGSMVFGSELLASIFCTLAIGLWLGVFVKQ